MKKILLLTVMMSILLLGCDNQDINNAKGIDEAKAEITTLINDYLSQPGMQIEITEVTEEYGLYKVALKANGQESTVYFSQDKQAFFPQGLMMEDIKKAKLESEVVAKEEQQTPVAEVTKNDKPVVELFVMSHCPYGTQIEKGILPVLDTLGDKIDFQLKFCDYAMHQKVELDEQMAQYCIQKSGTDKIVDYLKCFLADQNKSAECINEIGLNQVEISECVQATDSQYKITENFNDKTTWVNGRFPKFDIHAEDNIKYGIKGSPSLVINGQSVKSGRDAAGLLAVICNAFTNPPAECETELSPAAPAPGFGFDQVDNASANAGCGT